MHDGCNAATGRVEVPYEALIRGLWNNWTESPVRCFDQLVRVGPQSSLGDDIGHGEGIMPQQIDVIVYQVKQSRRILISDRESLLS